MSGRIQTVVRLFVVILCALPAGVFAEWQPAADNKLESRAADAVVRLKSRVPRSQTYFDDAYAIAVWPGVTRVAAGFGISWGKGVVIEDQKSVGAVRIWQGSSGIQAGAKHFALVIFFKDKATLDGLKRGDLQFTGQAGVDIGTIGAAGTPAYNEGVAVMTLTNLGLMAEFSAAGTWFQYKSYDP